MHCSFLCRKVCVASSDVGQAAAQAISADGTLMYKFHPATFRDANVLHRQPQVAHSNLSFQTIPTELHRTSAEHSVHIYNDNWQNFVTHDRCCDFLSASSITFRGKPGVEVITYISSSSCAESLPNKCHTEPGITDYGAYAYAYPYASAAQFAEGRDATTSQAPCTFCNLSA